MVVVASPPNTPTISLALPLGSSVHKEPRLSLPVEHIMPDIRAADVLLAEQEEEDSEWEYEYHETETEVSEFSPPKMPFSSLTAATRASM